METDKCRNPGRGSRVEGRGPALDSGRWTLDHICLLVCLAVALAPVPLAAQSESVSAPPLTPVTNLQAGDVPDDDGKAVFLTWPRMPYDDVEGTEYVVEMAAEDAGSLTEVVRFPANTRWKSDKELPFWMWEPDPDVHYVEISTASVGPSRSVSLRLTAVRGQQRAESAIVQAMARSNWIDRKKMNNFLYMVVFSVIILLFIEFARRRDLFLRRIPGLNAVDEAVGRAAEMGRPIYYLTGRLDISEISTIAASIILGEIAKKAAFFDVKLRVPHTYSLAMAVCREITKEAYTEAGRPDAYSDDINFFVTEDQFSYTAAVDGMMMREKPGACFYMGYYYAESLLLAEAGATTGAIQIAGTDAEAQLPFFVTACDYTLIGEELYAASAYLSRKPELVGTLRGQDVGKTVVMGVILLGVIAQTVFQLVGGTGLNFLFDFVRNFG